MANKLDFWWEDEMDRMLFSMVNNEYVGPADVKLLIAKIIDTEKGLIYPPIKYGKKDRDKAKKLRSEGKSLREIGKIMGIKGAQSVNNLIK